MVNRVSLVIVSLCAAAVVCRAEAPARMVARVRLTFNPDSSSTLIESIRSDAIAEAAHVWEPYGIAISDGAGAGADADVMSVLVVVD